MNQDVIGKRYYGHTVRAIFIIVGLLMLITFPFFSDLTPVPIPVSIAVIILLAVFGGLLNPSSKWIIVMHVLLPIVGLAIFEYQAVYGYLNLSPVESRHVAFFWMNQIVSVLFFVATYLSIKTLRWMFTKKLS